MRRSLVFLSCAFLVTHSLKKIWVELCRFYDQSSFEWNFKLWKFWFCMEKMPKKWLFLNCCSNWIGLHPSDQLNRTVALFLNFIIWLEARLILKTTLIFLILTKFLREHGKKCMHLCTRKEAFFPTCLSSYSDTWNLQWWPVTLGVDYLYIYVNMKSIIKVHLLIYSGSKWINQASYIY